MENIAFRPDGTITIAAVNNTSVAAALPASVNQSKTIEVTNPTNGVCFAKLGVAGVTAAATDYPIPAGGSKRFSMQGASTHIAIFLISGATNGNVYVSRGEGI